ncbi:MAG: WD40 repeat domain-containing protein, partial [Pseudonocardiaceae bacterium]
MPVDLVGALVGWLVSVAGDAGFRLARPLPKERALSEAMSLASDEVVAQVTPSLQAGLRAGLRECFSRSPQLRLDAFPNVGDGLRAAVAAQVSQLDHMVHTDTGQPFYQAVPVGREWLSEQVTTAILAALRHVVAAGEPAGLVHALDMAELLARLEALSSFGTVQHRYFHGPFQRLHDVTIDLDSLPGDLRLVDLADPANPLGCFTGREWLIERIDKFIDECVTRRTSGYVLVEAEAGMGKSALATYLAFTRIWPTHVTRLPGGTSPEAARANLAAQVIARWELSDAVPDGVLPPGHDTTAWLYKQLCAAARRRDETEPTTPVVVLVDGLDEAPPVVPPQLPLGLPDRLPSATVVVATTRPGTRLPAGMRVERIDVENQLNRDDLQAYLRRITTDDPQLAQALARARMDQEKFCSALLKRSGGVWIYALSVLEEIRDQRRSPAEVDALPQGLAGYYANNIMRWQNDPAFSWEDATLPLLATLATARQPQPASTLAHWSGVELRVAKGLLRGPFKAFLVVRGGGDPDVYALRHQSLRDLLEGRLPAGSDDQVRYLAHDLAETTRRAHSRIVAALLPDGDPASRKWDAVDAYTRAHLAEHAALGGWLDELVCDPEFLLIAGVPELLRLRRHLASTTGAAAVAALELASNSWAEKHDDKLQWLEVSARKFRCAPLAKAVATHLDAPWHCRTALWSGTSHRELAGHTGSVLAVAAVSLPDGSTLLASAGGDRTVRLWDPLTGVARGELVGHSGSVWAVAAVSLPDGSTLLASERLEVTARCGCGIRSPGWPGGSWS